MRMVKFALGKRRADMFRVGIVIDRIRNRADTLGRAVAAFAIR
jgi:hypothetical protein